MVSRKYEENHDSDQKKNGPQGESPADRNAGDGFSGEGAESLIPHLRELESRRDRKSTKD